MTRSKEEQVEAASREYSYSRDGFKEIARKLLDGYYAEPELPAITHPGKFWLEPCLHQYQAGWAIHAYPTQYAEINECLKGPVRRTSREAILAWNAGMQREQP